MSDGSKPSLAVAGALVLAMGVGCVSRTEPSAKVQPAPASAMRALQELKARHAPGNQFGLYAVGLRPEGAQLVLTGMVDKVVAKTESEQAMRTLGIPVTSAIKVLPDPE